MLFKESPLILKDLLNITSIKTAGEYKVKNSKIYVHEMNFNNKVVQNFNDMISKLSSKSNESYLKYADFLKRGLLFLLDEKFNKIIIIVFDPFINVGSYINIKKFALNNRERYNAIYISTGHGTFEKLK